MLITDRLESIGTRNTGGKHTTDGVVCNKNRKLSALEDATKKGDARAVMRENRPRCYLSAVWYRELPDNRIRPGPPQLHLVRPLRLRVPISVQVVLPGSLTLRGVGGVGDGDAQLTVQKPPATGLLSRLV